jgi:hypothetical protein
MVVIVIVALQVGIPSIALLREERPSRLGWQMFAASSPPPEVIVLADDGDPLDRTAPDYIARYRPDVPYHRHLPPHICEVEPRAHSVVIVDGRTGREVTHRC